jgi:hypothetical protein
MSVASWLMARASSWGPTSVRLALRLLREVARSARRDNGVRVFVLTGAGNYPRWQSLDRLVRRWPDIESVTGVEAAPYMGCAWKRAVT